LEYAVSVERDGRRDAERTQLDLVGLPSEIYGVEICALLMKLLCVYRYSIPGINEPFTHIQVLHDLWDTTENWKSSEKIEVMQYKRHYLLF
jgi:hypothetical protein